MSFIKPATVVLAALSQAFALPAWTPPSTLTPYIAADLGTHVTYPAAYDTYEPPSQWETLRQWALEGTQEYPIHASCNRSETALLRQAFVEAETLAAHARDHIQRFGNSSSYYLKYFGRATSAEPAGWLDRVVNADKAGVLFRCDDPDHNCATQEGA